MKLEDLARANDIVARIDSLESKLDTIASLEESLNNAQSEHKPSLILKEFNFQLRLESGEGEFRELYKKTIKSVKSILEKQKKDLERELEKI